MIIVCESVAKRKMWEERTACIFSPSVEPEFNAAAGLKIAATWISEAPLYSGKLTNCHHMRLDIDVTQSALACSARVRDSDKNT